MLEHEIEYGDACDMVQIPDGSSNRIQNLKMIFSKRSSG